MRAEEYLVSECYLRDRIRTVMVRCAVFVCRQIGDDELMRKMRARLVARTSLVVWLLVLGVTPQSAAPADNSGLVQQSDLREWLGYIASDELQGRQVFTEGLGLAAGYIADHLEEWGVKPAGEDGTYFQTVKVLGVRTTSKASVTVEVNGETRTFKDGEGIVFPKQHGRQADDHGRQDPVRRLRSADAVGG